MRRVRRWQIIGVLLVLLGASLWAAPVPVAASPDHVTTCANTGAGSLPAIVASALANDTIVFDQDCTGANAIMLTATIAPGVNLTIDATVGNRSVVVDGGNAVTVFRINGGVVTLNGLTIQHGNGSQGGGIFNYGTLTVTNSTLSGNSASFGGSGVYNLGTLTVTNSTLSGNSATNGGGIEIDFGTLTVTNSTFTGNHANGTNGSNGGGGGIFINPSRVTVTNTLIAGNTASTGPDVNDPGGFLRSGGHNLIGKTDGSSGWVASDRTGTVATPLNPLLGPLASNGGLTQTFGLLSGSPAIGAGDPVICRQSGVGKVNGVDQRGLPRLASTCDTGAYQLQGTQLIAGSSSGPVGTPLTLTVVLLDGYSNALAPYTGTVHLTSTDPLATLPADYPFTGAGGGKDNGVHVFFITFRTAGPQTVSVTDTLAGTLTDQTILTITPAVTSVGPPSGGTAGGNRVTLTGLGFGTTPANVAVTFGGSPAAVVSVTNTQLVVTAPAHAAGAVNVVVTANGQATTVTGGYTYGVVTALPGGRLVGGAASSPSPLPAGRTPAGQQGNANPLPEPRP